MSVILLSFVDELLKIAKYVGGKGPKWKTLQKGGVPLLPEERELVMKRKAIWHHGPKGEPTPAVKKSIVNGKTWYVTATHRAYNVRPTLKATIRRYHDFVKGTA